MYLDIKNKIYISSVVSITGPGALPALIQAEHEKARTDASTVDTSILKGILSTLALTNYENLSKCFDVTLSENSWNNTGENIQTSQNKKLAASTIRNAWHNYKLFTNKNVEKRSQVSDDRIKNVSSNSF